MPKNRKMDKKEPYSISLNICNMKQIQSAYDNIKEIKNKTTKAHANSISFLTKINGIIEEDLPISEQSKLKLQKQKIKEVVSEIELDLEKISTVEHTMKELCDNLYEPKIKMKKRK